MGLTQKGGKTQRGLMGPWCTGVRAFQVWWIVLCLELCPESSSDSGSICTAIDWPCALRVVTQHKVAECRPACPSLPGLGPRMDAYLFTLLFAHRGVPGHHHGGADQARGQHSRPDHLGRDRQGREAQSLQPETWGPGSQVRGVGSRWALGGDDK